GARTQLPRYAFPGRSLACARSGYVSGACPGPGRAASNGGTGPADARSMHQPSSSAVTPVAVIGVSPAPKTRMVSLGPERTEPAQATSQIPNDPWATTRLHPM